MFSEADLLHSYATLGEPVTVELDGQGPRLESLRGSHPIVGVHREDGSVVRAVLPEAHNQEGVEGA